MLEKPQRTDKKGIYIIMRKRDEKKERKRKKKERRKERKKERERKRGEKKEEERGRPNVARASRKTNQSLWRIKSAMQPASQGDCGMGEKKE